jgi:hypothetical protein
MAATLRAAATRPLRMAPGHFFLGHNDKGPPIGDPSVHYLGLSGKRMTQHYGLVAVRTGGNNINRRTDQLFNALNVGTRSSRQLF